MKDTLKIQNELNFLNSRFTTLLNLKLTVKSLDKSKALTNLLSRIAAKIILLNKKLAFINLKESDLRYKAVCLKTNKVEEHLLYKWYNCNEIVKNFTEINYEVQRVQEQLKFGNYNVAFKKLRVLVRVLRNKEMFVK